MKNPLILFTALGLASCAAPKAVVIQETPVEAPKPEAPSPTPAGPRNPVVSAPDDGLRIGDDILALPKDEELRSSNPSGDSDSTIIARPPADD